MFSVLVDKITDKDHLWGLTEAKEYIENFLSKRMATHLSFAEGSLYKLKDHIDSLSHEFESYSSSRPDIGVDGMLELIAETSSYEEFSQISLDSSQPYGSIIHSIDKAIRNEFDKRPGRNEFDRHGHVDLT